MVLALRGERPYLFNNRFTWFPRYNRRSADGLKAPLILLSGPITTGRRIGITSIIPELVGLSHRKDHLPHELSGGEMQRVAIGRSLINDPKIILADEPTGNLDSENADQVYRIFQDMVNHGYTLIIVTHNTELAGKASRVVHLRDGMIVKGF